MKIEQIFEKFLTGDRCRWYDSRRKGAARMPDRTYLAIDLNNAEEKEMPISFGST